MEPDVEVVERDRGGKKSQDHEHHHGHEIALALTHQQVGERHREHNERHRRLRQHLHRRACP